MVGSRSNHGAHGVVPVAVPAQLPRIPLPGMLGKRGRLKIEIVVVTTVSPASSVVHAPAYCISICGVPSPCDSGGNSKTALC